MAFSVYEYFSHLWVIYALWSSHCKLNSSSCTLYPREPQTQMGISVSVMSAVWTEVYMLCGYRNSLSMRYGGVSEWGVKRKCHSMVVRYEKGSTMGTRQRCSRHCFCPIWIFGYRKQLWHSCQGTVLSPSRTVHWTAVVHREGALYLHFSNTMVECPLIPVMPLVCWKAMSVTFIFAPAKNYFQRSHFQTYERSHLMTTIIMVYGMT